MTCDQPHPSEKGVALPVGRPEAAGKYHLTAIQITAPTAAAKPTAKSAMIRFRSLSLLAIQATLLFMLAISSTLRFSLST